jgi:hypothetical protein
MALTAAQAALLGGVNGYAASQGGGSQMMGGGMSSLAYSNPYSAAAMAAGQAFSSMMGSTPSNTTSGSGGTRSDYNSVGGSVALDGSGWTVSTGSSKASSVPTLTSAAQGVAQTAIAATQNPMLLLAAVALVMVWRNHKG